MSQKMKAVWLFINKATSDAEAERCLSVVPERCGLCVCVLHLHLYWRIVVCIGFGTTLHQSSMPKCKLALDVLHWCIFDWMLASPSSSQLRVRRSQRACGTRWRGTKL